MRNFINLISSLTEDEQQKSNFDLSVAGVESALVDQLGLITKRSGNTIQVLSDLPNKNKNEFRIKTMQDIANQLAKLFNVQSNYNSTQTSVSTIGYVELAGSPAKIVVKDATKQGLNRNGVANEHQLVTLIMQSIQQYGSVNVTFKDQHGKTLVGSEIVSAEATGTDVQGGKKADVVLQGKNARIPISIKQVNAEVWESADSLFGARARDILLKLMEENQVELKQVGQREVRGEIVPVYKISREIVVEPTPEDAMRAIFGSDLNPAGGIIIQDFQPDHFVQQDYNITVDCYAVITSREEIPDSHLMYFLIKNFPGRAALGFYGIGTQAVTMTRAFGKKLTKNPIFVDQTGEKIAAPSNQLAEWIDSIQISKMRQKR